MHDLNRPEIHWDSYFMLNYCWMLTPKDHTNIHLCYLRLCMPLNFIKLYSQNKNFLHTSFLIANANETAALTNPG